MQDYAQQSSHIIRSKLPKDFSPKVGLILGSGLGALADAIKVVASFDYQELPGFFISTIPGHAGKLILGYLENVPVVCMKGRAHLYEGASFTNIKTAIRTIKNLGAETILITNAAGIMSTDIEPGSVVLIKDQINFTGTNVLSGPNDEAYGPRFVGMEDAFDPKLRELFKQAAKKHQIVLPEGVYFGVLGPSYESPAEIRAFQKLGGDLVGMSTIHEVIAARHCGLKVAALSAVTNYAAGLSSTFVNHEEVLFFAHEAADRMTKLLLEVIQSL